MTAEERNEMTDEERKRERQRRQERMVRGFEELQEIFRRNRKVFDRWRAEGILPPEEPRRRF